MKRWNRLAGGDRRWRLVCLVATLLYSLAPALTSAQGAQSQRERNALRLIQQEHHRLQERFHTALERLAQDCETNGLPQAASNVRRYAAPIATQLLRVELLPSEVHPEIPLDLPKAEREVQFELLKLRREHAKDLYLLSRRALYGGSPTYAYRLIRETAQYDSDHKSARRLLGFVRHGDEWVTPFAAKMSREKQVWHDQYGWLPKAHVDRYEQGQRYFNRRWITAAQEAEYRRDFQHAWEVRTEHYLVKTNHSLERGVEIARKLEDYYDFFTETFAAFFNTPEQLQKLFQGSSRSGRPTVKRDPYEVHYYRTRDEYNQRLAKKIPQIEITNGLYYTTDRVAYFFDAPQENMDATLFHEATHQLFYETTPRDRSIADKNSFWIIEGIACYMESFQSDGGQLSVGDPDYDRFVAARYRFLVDGYYVPLERFSAMGMQAFQTDSVNLSKNYSQASGLAHFLMHYDDGEYRDALIEHLAQLYDDNPRRRRGAQLLDELTGVSFEELDRQYAEYLKQLDDSPSSDQVSRR